MPKAVNLGAGARGGKKMYPGGSKRFNESTGTYRGKPPPSKGTRRPISELTVRPGGGRSPGRMVPVKPGGKFPARPAGYFGGGASGAAARNQYQAQRAASKLGSSMNRKASLRGRAGTRGAPAPSRRAGFVGAQRQAATKAKRARY